MTTPFSFPLPPNPEKFTFFLSSLVFPSEPSSSLSQFYPQTNPNLCIWEQWPSACELLMIQGLFFFFKRFSFSSNFSRCAINLRASIEKLNLVATLSFLWIFACAWSFWIMLVFAYCLKFTFLVKGWWLMNAHELKGGKLQRHSQPRTISG